MWRPSASMILLKRLTKPTTSGYNYKILCQKRGNISNRGLYAFPGGAYDKEDISLLKTALRELYEETGILHYHGNDNEFSMLRRQLDSDPEYVHSLWGAASNIPEVFHYCTFITPIFEKKRFSTMFFLSEICHTRTDNMVTDGAEVELNHWLDPAVVLFMHQQADIKMLPPQFYIFHNLSRHRCIDGLLTELREVSRENTKSRRYCPDEVTTTTDCRGYPPMRPTPVTAQMPSGDDVDAVVTLALPLDEQHDVYPGASGDRHRIRAVKPIGTGSYSFEVNLATDRLRPN